MSSANFTRQFALVAGGAAIAVMATLSACSSNKSPEAPTTPTVAPSQSESATPPPSSSPSLNPTDKALSPSGPNSFTPTINAGQPGAVCKQVIGNSCIR